MAGKQVALVVCKTGQERDALKNGLISLGFEVAFASTPEQGVEVLNSMKPQLLVHDWQISDPSRCTRLHSRLRKYPELRSVKTLVYCDDAVNALKSYAIDYEFGRVVDRSKVQEILVPEVREMFNPTQPNPIQVAWQKLEKASQKGGDELDETVQELNGKFPADSRIGVEFGNLCLRKQKHKEALGKAEDILKLVPSNVRAMNLAARALMAVGDMKKAIEILEKANTLSPKNPDRLVQMGQAYFDAGDNDKARKSWLEAIEVEPDSKDARKGLGALELQAGNSAQALAIFKESCSEEELAGFFNNAAVLAINQGKFDQGLKLYDMAFGAIKSPALKAKVRYNVGLAHKKKGNTPQARQAFEDALKLNPDYDKARLKLKEMGA